MKSMIAMSAFGLFLGASVASASQVVCTAKFVLPQDSAGPMHFRNFRLQSNGDIDRNGRLNFNLSQDGFQFSAAVSPREKNAFLTISAQDGHVANAGGGFDLLEDSRGHAQIFAILENGQGSVQLECGTR